MVTQKVRRGGRGIGLVAGHPFGVGTFLVRFLSYVLLWKFCSRRSWTWWSRRRARRTADSLPEMLDVR